MAEPSRNMETALASLRERWGAAAPRWGTQTAGALAIAPQPLSVPALPPADELPLGSRGVPTGFRSLDAILSVGGLPRGATTALEGEGSSGKTTLALRAVAEAQAAGGVAGYIDLARALDPVEAVARGVQLDWLVVLTPDTLDEALAMAAMLLQDRAIDVLVLDLPAQPKRLARTTRPADRLQRLTALARKADVELLVLQPPRLPDGIRSAIADVAALRLQLSRRAWIRLGGDVVGQRTEVRVARSRFGAAGRTAELRILYADGGFRDACLLHEELLSETPDRLRSVLSNGGAPPGASRLGAPSGALPRPRVLQTGQPAGR